jgi:choline-sulfatase
MPRRAPSARPASGALACLLAALVVVGCRSDDRSTAATPAERDVVVDLRAVFAESVHQPPTLRIDPADAARLVHGWSAPESRADGAAVVQLLEPIGAIEFAAGATPVDQTVTVRASALAAPTVVEVNGRRLGRLTLRRTPSGEAVATTLRMPASLQRPGRNTLTIRTGRGRGRGAPWLLLHGVELAAAARPPTTARIDAASGALVLDPGARVELLARAPAAARLRLAADGDAALAVSVATDGGGERTLVTRAAPRVDVDPGVAPGEPFALRLAVPPDAAPVTLTTAEVTGRAPAPPASARVAARPSVLVYVADTLRADRLGAYGYTAPTSPHLDALARDGITFARAIGASSWTRPSTATLLTGLPPSEHGAITLRDPIRADAPRLARVFHDAGYATAGFVTNVNVADRFGFGAGFDRYEHLPEDTARPGVHVPAADLHAAALGWLDGLGDAPFFLYLHATDTHAPYAPAPELAARFVPPGLSPAFGPDTAMQQIADDVARVTPDDVRALSGRYDAEIAGLDAAFGALVVALETRGLWDDLVVVFVADHGEEFLEHGGFEHGRTVHREVVDVPLLLRLPDDAGAGQRATDLARHVDVAPTVLALAGLAPASPLPGRVVVGPDGTLAPAPAVDAVTETYLGRHRLQALVTAREKVVVDGRNAAVTVYDTVADPGETVDRAGERPVLAAYARQQLARSRDAVAWSGAARAGGGAIDRETAERLRALGYLHD